MSSHKQKRIALTPSPEVDDVLVRIALFEKRSKTSVINDLLVDSLPLLKALADAYDAVQHNKDPSSIIQSMSALALSKVSELTQVMADVSNAQASKKCADTLELPL